MQFAAENGFRSCFREALKRAFVSFSLILTVKDYIVVPLMAQSMLVDNVSFDRE